MLRANVIEINDSPKIFDESVHLISVAQIIASRKKCVRHSGFVVPVHLSDAWTQAHLRQSIFLQAYIILVQYTTDRPEGNKLRPLQIPSRWIPHGSIC